MSEHQPLSAGIPVQASGAAVGLAVPPADPRRWKALAVLALVQFMLILDVTVVNVALPHIQTDLHFSRAGLAWVVDGYVLMAGGFLLLGGRLSDLFGRRRLFLIGLTVFGLASALCGAAQSSGMLVGARFAQGVGEALAAPAALGLVALLFPDPGERTKALGLWGGIAGVGGTTGTIISGVLTNIGQGTWRWIFFVNIPVAAFALIVTPRLVKESRAQRTTEPRRPDVVGAVTVTGGLVALVYGLLRASEVPWGSRSVVLSLIGGVLAAGRLRGGRGDDRGTAGAAALLPQPHSGDRQRGDPVLHQRVLHLLLPADAVLAAGAAVVGAQDRTRLHSGRRRYRLRRSVSGPR